MIETIEGLPASVLGFRLSGDPSKDQLNDGARPLYEEIAAVHNRVRLLCILEPGYSGYSFFEAWEDLKAGVWDEFLFERQAYVVEDVDRLRAGMSNFGAILPIDHKLFGLEEIDQARAWIVEGL